MADDYNIPEEPKVCNHYTYGDDKLKLREDSFRDKNLITTPGWIVKDMLDLLPDSVWNTETTFLIPCIKSGNFAIEVKNRLMKCKDAMERFPDYDDRRKHIDSKQLFCIYWYTEEEFNKNLISGHIWGITGFLESLYSSSVNLMCTNDLNFDTFKDKTGKKQEKLLESIKEKFGTVKFDVVIGNPPYNNDLYIDFVEWGHQRANKCSLWITPAKWQAKGGDKNERFRKTIVPHMSKIVYYPNVKDIFDIACSGGVCYYLIDMYETGKSMIKNCDKNNAHNGFNTDFEEIDIKTHWSLFNSSVQSIIGKVKKKKERIYSFNDDIKMYNLIATSALSGGNCGSDHRFYDYDNKISVVSNFKVMKSEQDINDYGSTLKIYYQSDKLDDCMSFKSYVDTRLIRFLIFLGLCKLSVRDNIVWRFVPDPQDWSVIYEDRPLPNCKPKKDGTYEYDGKKHCSLYIKYDLSEDEIKIIESVIKERK